MNIVAGAGYYVDASHPTNMNTLSEENICQQIIKELQEGCDGTDIKAGVIGEIGCSWPLTGTYCAMLFNISSDNNGLEMKHSQDGILGVINLQYCAPPPPPPPNCPCIYAHIRKLMYQIRYVASLAPPSRLCFWKYLFVCLFVF